MNVTQLIQAAEKALEAATELTRPALVRVIWWGDRVLAARRNLDPDEGYYVAGLQQAQRDTEWGDLERR